MTLTCKTISDPTEKRLCKIVGARSADAGAVRIDYRKVGSRPLIRGSANSAYEASEIFRAALHVPTGKAQALKRATVFQQTVGQPIPWIPNARNWTKITTALAGIKRSLRSQGIGTKHSQYRARLARGIYAWVKKTLRMNYREHSKPEGTIDDVFTRKYFRCSEFVTLMYGIAHIAGLKAYPVEIHRSGNRKHAAIAIVTGSKTNNIVYIDGKDGCSKKPKYRHYYLGGVNDLFGWYLHNKSLVRAGKATTTVQPANAHFIKLASRVAPHNALVNYSLGTYYANQSSWRAAVSSFKRAAELRRGHDYALDNYCNALFAGALGICTTRMRAHYKRKGVILP